MKIKMEDFYSQFCTNYFSVTNVEALKRLVAFYNESDEGFIKYQIDRDKVMLYGKEFSSFFYDEDYKEEYYFYSLLQKLLPEDEAVIWKEAGFEDFIHPFGECVVITSCKRIVVDMQKEALEIAKELLENPNYRTIMFIRKI